MTYGLQSTGPGYGNLQLSSYTVTPFYVGDCPTSLGPAIGGMRVMTVYRPSGYPPGSGTLLLAIKPNISAENWVAGDQYIANGASSTELYISDTTSGPNILAFLCPQYTSMPGGSDGYGMQLFNEHGHKIYDSSFKHMVTSAIGSAAGPPGSYLGSESALLSWVSGVPICNANPNYAYILPSIDVFVGVRNVISGEPTEYWLRHLKSAVVFSAGALLQTKTVFKYITDIGYSSGTGTVGNGTVYHNINPNGYYSVAVEVAKYW